MVVSVTWYKHLGAARDAAPAEIQLREQMEGLQAA
jgi:hypothetical protein